MQKQRIGIIGAGVAGLAAGWTLDRAGHEIVIYEKDEVWGGNVSTITVDDGGYKTTFDPAARLFAPRIYPNTVALARMLGIEMIPAPFGFTIALKERGICGTNHQDTTLWREIESECIRFTLEMEDLSVLNSVEVISCSIGEYLQSRGYSPTFISVIDGVGPALMGQNVNHKLETSVVSFAMDVTSGLFSFFLPAPSAMTFKAGMQAFSDGLARPIASRIKLCRAVSAISRSAVGVRITDEHGAVEHFDQAISAVDGQLTRAMIADPSPLEDSLLANCQMQEYPAIVHGDGRVLIPGIDDADRTAMEVNEYQIVTQNVAASQRRHRARPLLITYSNDVNIDPALVHRRYDFRACSDNTYAFEVRKNIHRIQGKNRLWFAGEWTFLATLETAMLSGFVIAEALGGTYPFPDDVRASKLYAVQRALMLNGQESFSLSV